VAGEFHMDGYNVFNVSWCAAFGGALIVSVVTGKTLNPIRGTSPFIVTRKEQPARYFGGLALLALFLLIGVWTATA
jgi:hypothetical protein